VTHAQAVSILYFMGFFKVSPKRLIFLEGVDGEYADHRTIQILLPPLQEVQS